MKIFKYNINKSQDFQFIIESETIELFGEDFITKNIHQPNENVFFMIATEEEHNKFMTILFNEAYTDFYEGSPASIKDVTFDVLNNIDKYENLHNINSDENVLLNLFFTYTDKDDVLDKILKCGIEKLNKFDKQILEAA